MGDERLVRALTGSACPVCAFADDAVARWLEAVLYEQVNDVAFRKRFDATGGFCRRHTARAHHVDRHRSGGALGIAILLQAALRPRLRALDGAARGRRVDRRMLEPLSDASDCMACAVERTAEADAISGSLENAARDEAWRAAITDGRYCLLHLRDVAVHASDGTPPLAEAIIAAQRERLRQVDEQLAAFQHHHGHDRRAPISDEERVALADARVALGGGER
jgi:hypothetical protein